MIRKKIAAGNWKMNTKVDEGVRLAETISQAHIPEDVAVVMAVPYTHIYPIMRAVTNPRVKIAAQNIHQEPKGAFTGEISAEMLLSLGARMAIIGHSERRAYHHESNELLKQKLDTALDNGFEVIFCCGEPLDVRKNGAHIDYVINQLRESTFHLTAQQWTRVVLAYEPIWAIGTGETASPDQAQEMHAEIRSAIASQYSSDTADQLSILYGGSVKPNNSREIFAQPDVDGGLVGGASLNPADFVQIINAFG